MKISLFKGIEFKILKAFVLSISIAFIVILVSIIQFLKIAYDVDYANWGNWANQHLILNTYILIVFFLIFIIITTILFYMFTKKIINRLHDINRNITKIAEGDFAVTIPVIANDELGMLADNINTMSKKLEDLINKDKENEKLKNDMISNVSHDLRSPLTSVIGYVEMMKNIGYEDKAVCDNCINIILRKCNEIKGLVEDLLEYTSINFKGININRENISIKDLIEQIMIDFIPRLEQSEMSFDIKANEQKIFVSADIKLIVRLFENIINNSIFYGKNGKRVDIEISERDNMASVKIINYGNKIPLEDQKYIFERFFRSEKSRNVNTGGKGMGLAIAKSIADVHKGDIKVNSDDKETIFEVLLPVCNK